MKPNKLETGDRVAYAAKFLKNTGQFTGSGGQRRGTFIRYTGTAGYCRVKWDDVTLGSEYARKLAELYGEDYLDDALANGQMVHATAIAKVGSPRFACNDL
jgi:hypothetical protein